MDNPHQRQFEFDVLRRKVETIERLLGRFLPTVIEADVIKKPEPRETELREILVLGAPMEPPPGPARHLDFKINTVFIPGGDAPMEIKDATHVHCWRSGRYKGKFPIDSPDIPPVPEGEELALSEASLVSGC